MFFVWFYKKICILKTKWLNSLKINTMKTKEIIKLLNKKYPKREIVGIRGLTKCGENEFNFRFTYKDGDFISISDLIIVNKDVDNKPVLVVKKIKQAH